MSKSKGYKIPTIQLEICCGSRTYPTNTKANAGKWDATQSQGIIHTTPHERTYKARHTQQPKFRIKLGTLEL